jgi:hypothetical protein
VRFEPLLFREGTAPGPDTDEACAREQPDDYVRRVTRSSARRAAWQRVVHAPRAAA